MNKEEIVEIAVNALEEIKGENIMVINTEKLTSLFSFIIICTANSNRQALALANSVNEECKTNNIKVIGKEGLKEGEWIIVDALEVVVHIMLPQVRSYYDLESLWQN